ncbi:MAG: energy transducer TonB [Paraburkholderia sp.]|uniref:energy transducer TonB n=1 Tax=Paraburkholderia sp. TaxID=1926495 RepID=UPI0011F9E0FA|nr:energy transducer TonB [Paraburkholderia sp.]TAL97526.1 MAG: energy transducer TonB [Paraburkholderia sp.]
MQASHNLPAGFSPTRSARFSPRIVTATAIVVGVHAALLVAVLIARDEPVPRALESRTITAELLSPAPVAAPVAIQSTPTPTPPKPTPPVPHLKPKVQPRPVSKPTPTPLPEAAAPSQHEIATPQPAPPAPAAPATPAPAPAEAALPATGKPTMALSAPKNVAHLDCSIAQPDYPVLSKRRNETGTAMVKFVVGLTGKIENIELKKSSGFGRLDDAALAAMRGSSCKPYIENGEAIRATYTQPFSFSLTD